MEQRRVGTFTLGVSLVLFGVLFICHIFWSSLNYLLIFHFWPVLFILLGVEILFYAVKAPDKHYRYDFAAILIIFLLVCFAMGMAGMDWMMENIPDKVWMQF